MSTCQWFFFDEVKFSCILVLIGVYAEGKDGGTIAWVLVSACGVFRGFCPIELYLLVSV